MSLKGEIFLIRWGLFPAPADTFNVSVGQFVGKKVKNAAGIMISSLQVLAIERERMDDGSSEFHIQCSKRDEYGNPKGEPFVWKTFAKKPDEVIYQIPDEKHDYKSI
ncbi:MAG: hypothetical protein V4721_10250 [Bacteroidota bacterium]